ncbi:conjugal transfer protein TrbC [Chelativorans sp. ZYF759]|uniref:TrbC/VirB2 family protein n=1 Tax=Chelativorans sp. ZYF759 TaxID=2692213 RepID=UPI00145E840C|nr:TrbC/VirB2 family protein [Chelativorans sp. ZYF759]NMG41427.1 conjugal transfer protein TrbC [Chelativorans sp. ZYF759]
MPHSSRRTATLWFIAAGFCLVAATPALAGGGGGLPWEGPLQQIQQSITGPVAGFIALAAVAVAGGMLIFGGELNDFARRLMYVVLVAGILLGATQIVGLFGASGASIGHVELTVRSGAGEGTDG